MPGEIIEINSSWQNDDFYHEFLLRRPDGSIFELEYFAITGELYEIEVDYLAEDAPLPFGTIGEEYAAKIAKDDIYEHTKGHQKVRVKDTDVDVYNRKLIYVVETKKGTREYQTYVDAFKGDILKVEKE